MRFICFANQTTLPNISTRRGVAVVIVRLSRTAPAYPGGTTMLLGRLPKFIRSCSVITDNRLELVTSFDFEKSRFHCIEAQDYAAQEAPSKISCHSPSDFPFVSMGDDKGNDTRMPPSIGLDRRPRPTHADMIDDDDVPILCQLGVQLALGHRRFMTGGDVWQRTEQAPKSCETGRFWRLGLEQRPFDAIGFRGTSIARSGPGRNRHSDLALSKVGDEMKAVGQISSIGAPRVYPSEPQTPQRLADGFPFRRYRFRGR